MTGVKPLHHWPRTSAIPSTGFNTSTFHPFRTVLTKFRVCQRGISFTKKTSFLPLRLSLYSIHMFISTFSVLHFWRYCVHFLWPNSHNLLRLGNSYPKRQPSTRETWERSFDSSWTSQPTFLLQQPVLLNTVKVLPSYGGWVSIRPESHFCTGVLSCFRLLIKPT